MDNFDMPSLRLESKISSSKLFRQPSFQNHPQQGKQKSIQQFLQSQNDMKIQSFKDFLSEQPNILTIEYEDNSRYVGQVNDDGMMQGIGMIETEEGDMYLGDWQNDTYHGYGMYICNEGERYEGELVGGEKQGEGKYFYKDGRVYEGMWSGDQREGEGVEKDTIKGVYYQGEWVNDQKHGRGKLCILNPTDWGFRPSQVSIMQGKWQNDKFSSGIIQTELYKGDFHNQTITGQGVYKFPDGSVYQGQFLNNLMHGQGVYYYPNGDVYEGEFYSGLKHGKGVYRYFTGDIYTGNYQKDIKSGQGRFVFVNGNYYVGEFGRDCFHGKGKYFFTKEEAVCGWWENGRVVRNERGEEIGGNRRMAVMRQNVENGNRTPRNDRSRSPLNHAYSTPNIQNPRSVSPFSLQRNGLNKQQKASMMTINPSKSPIKSSKFMQVHTPRNSYFKSPPNVQYPLTSVKKEQESSMKVMTEERMGERKNGLYVRRGIDSKGEVQRQDQRRRQSNRRQREADRNLFELMTEGERELEKIQRGAKNQQSSSQQVKKISKKFER